jgi:hypothetical protein
MTTTAPNIHPAECQIEMMVEELTRLTSEVERVVTAPYVPSLQVNRALVREQKTAIVDTCE